MWIYNQSNGTFSKNGHFVGHGYSGFGVGKNNPALQNLVGVGPIPEGSYEIGPPHDTTTHGPHVMALSPEEGTDTFGRGGFLIQGDSIEHPGTASHGCIVLADDLRVQVSSSSDTQLRVI
jgi:hypothetical protein